jgi:hypothetical protein
MHLNKLKIYGKLTIYQLPDPIPLVYSPFTIIASPYKNYTFLRYQVNDSFAIIDSEAWNLSSSINKAQLTYEKINPTQYRVKVNSSEPFFIVLSQNFDKNWNAYVVKSNNREKISTHILVNGFANGWFINNSGSLEIIITYDLQEPVENILNIWSVVLITLTVIVISSLLLHKCAFSKILYKELGNEL